ncbi:MAG: hypothetical protein K6F04_04320 [bacterium]|nr:hypothetical protein [bacterium]
MQKDKKTLSFVPLKISIALCLVLILSALFIAISFSASLEEDNFKIDGIAVARFKNTNNEFEVIPFNNDIPSTRKQEFMKNYLKEYVVNRYTVSGNIEEMNQSLGYNAPDSLNGGILLKYPSYMGTENGQPVWTSAYQDFIKNDLPEIKELLNSNTTRSVRILSEPKKSGDWWSITVEFIYRNPTTYSLSVARKEKYEIRLNIKSYGIKQVDQINPYFPAGNVFATIIINIQKIKL